MELSGGEAAAVRADSSSSVADVGQDRLSELPDDILILILSRIRILEAARTCVLSRRWRRVWALLPELVFFFVPHPDRIRDALDAHGGDLRVLSVGTRNASLESVAAWLPVAARRLSGRLTFLNLARRARSVIEDAEARAQRGAFEMPCFESATSVSLRLGGLGLSVPPAGVFARLTELCLRDVEFHFPCELGEAVSSPRCPCLQKLCIGEALGLNKLAINSDSLLQVDLDRLDGLQQLTVVAPALQYLRVAGCIQDQSAVCISAPQLECLDWKDPYDPSLVNLGNMEHVQKLVTTNFSVYAPLNFRYNLSFLWLFKHFKLVGSLFLTLTYMRELRYNLFFMDGMTMLPYTTNLHLHVKANGHVFGASLFHVLRMCSGIRKLILVLNHPDTEEQTACPSDCICRQQEHWKTEELQLNCLQEAEITELGVSEHEIIFMKQLFIWATSLKSLTLTFDNQVTGSKAKEFCQMLRSFSRPEICMKFCGHNGTNKLYVLE